MTTAASGGNREEPQPDSHWQAGQAELDAEAPMRREVPGLATEGNRR